MGVVYVYDFCIIEKHNEIQEFENTFNHRKLTLFDNPVYVVYLDSYNTCMKKDSKMSFDHFDYACLKDVMLLCPRPIYELMK